jgi:hypothetical protein
VKHNPCARPTSRAAGFPVTGTGRGARGLRRALSYGTQEIVSKLTIPSDLDPDPDRDPDRDHDHDHDLDRDPDLDPDRDLDPERRRDPMRASPSRFDPRWP